MSSWFVYHKRMDSRLSISTSIFYPNAEPHLGHALELVQTDFLARYYRKQGRSVFFQTGLDEHGRKIEKTATAAGLSPEDFVDQQQEVFKKLVEVLSISPDRFIRTTDADHLAVAQALWSHCLETGDIYKKTYRAWYNIKEEEFVANADEVTDPSSLNIESRFLELIEEENYFFRLSKYADQVISLIKSDQYVIVPAGRKEEILNFASQGLQDISISREKKKLAWGVPVPNDPDQVMYVWFDALTNYLTGLTKLENDGSITPNKFWPYDLHCVGKDIARFHALIWPAMLLSAGLQPPKKLLVHGFIMIDGRKMSKSLGNVIDPFTVQQELGGDALRWFLLARIPTTGDGDFTLQRFHDVYSSDLANDFGNLVSRVMTMARNYTGGVPDVDPLNLENLEQVLIEEAWQGYHQKVADLEIDAALMLAQQMVVFANRRIEELKPWVLAKDETKRSQLEELLYELLEIIRQVANMYEPALPVTIQSLRTSLFAELSDDEFSQEAWGGLRPGMSIPDQNFQLFPRLLS